MRTAGKLWETEWRIWRAFVMFTIPGFPSMARIHKISGPRPILLLPKMWHVQPVDSAVPCGHACTGDRRPRRMTCTRNLHLIPPRDRPADSQNHATFVKGGAVRVYEITFTPQGDVHFEGWKSFRLDLFRGAEPRSHGLEAYVKAELARAPVPNA